MAELVTVTGRFENPDESPVDGWLEWVLVPNHIPDSANDVDVYRGPVRAMLVDGEFTVQVRATDDPDLVDHVDGPIVYRVRHSAGAEWDLVVPAPGPWDWTDLAPPADSPGVVIPIPGAPGPPGPAGPTGSQGPAGPVGATGSTGPQGIQGSPGSTTVIRGEVPTVAALPPAASVTVGDSYIVTADGDLYTSTGTAWVDVGQIVGPQGPTGATGSTGPAGTNGTNGTNGAPGAPGSVGAQGPVGPQGAAGPAGGGTVSDTWVWISAATAAGTVGATRVAVNQDAPASATLLLIHKESSNANIDYSTTISALRSGDHIYLQAKADASRFHRYTLTGTPTLSGGTTWNVPVTTDSGSPSGTEPANGADVLVAFQFSPLQGPTGPAGPAGATGPGVPTGGTTAQALTKTSSADYATAWTTLTKSSVGLGNVDNTADTAKPVSTATQTALDAKVAKAGDSMSGDLDMTFHQIHNVATPTDDEDAATKNYVDEMFVRSIKADTTTGYAPILGDELLMITLSNAGAITVTMPSDATQAFPVASEIDFVWWGVGQPTFAAGSGATVNGTPGLKLRARYSAATAKKMAANTWLIIGDVSA